MRARRRDDPQIVWDTTDAAGWHALLCRAGRSSLEQSWAYGAALEAAGGRRARRGVVADTAGPIAVVQAFERRVRPLGTLVQIVRGPLWLRDEVDFDDRLPALRCIAAAWRPSRRELLLWMPELRDGDAGSRLMQALGTRRMVTGYSSAWLDLNRPEEALRAGLRGKWRNMLRAAEGAGMRVETISGPGAALDWLIGEYEPFRRRARFHGPPGTLIRAFAAAVPDARDVQVLRAFAEDRPVAGILLLRHGRAATYYIGWTGAEGRRLRAHHLLLWRGALALREGGTRWLDLGGLFAATAPGVARFKLGLGGEVFTLSGTYLPRIV